MEDRDNQQEITETDKAWLAAMIEGEGHISMGFHKYNGAKGRRRFAVKPTIGFANQDELLIEKVASLIKAIGAKGTLIREVRGHYEHSRNSMKVTLCGMTAVLRVLENLIPYLVGSKVAKARLLAEFIKSRLARDRTHQGNPYYNEEELLIIEKFYQNTQRKGGKRNPEIGEILRDYMCNLKIEEDIVRST